MNISSVTDRNITPPPAELQQLQGEETQDRVERVFSQKVKRKWTREEEDVLKNTVEKYNQENPDRPVWSGPIDKVYCLHAFSIIVEYPEIKELGRNFKRIREKWVRDLCPNSLAGRIRRNHREIIEELYERHPNKWTLISKKFAEMVLPDKPSGKYYSDNAIKNYFYTKNRKIQNGLARDLNKEGTGSFSSTTVESEEMAQGLSDHFEDSEYSGVETFKKRKRTESKVGRVFSQKVKRKWTREEEDVLKKSVEKYNQENPDRPAYSDPNDTLYYSEAFSIIAKYPEVEPLGRDSKQMRKKWIQELCPNCLGERIPENHKSILEALYKKHPNKWTLISKIFAEKNLPDKPSGKYYSENAIKNYFYTKKRKIQSQLVRDFRINKSAAPCSLTEDLDSGLAQSGEEGTGSIHEDPDFFEGFFDIEEDLEFL